MKIDYADDTATDQVDAYLGTLRARNTAAKRLLKHNGHDPGRGQRAMENGWTDHLDAQERSRLRAFRAETHAIIRQAENGFNVSEDDAHAPVRASLRSI